MRGAVRILGIDPGYGRCGWGVVDYCGNRFTDADCGVIETSSKMKFPERLKILHDELRTIIENIQPHESAIEQLYFSKNVKTAIDVGQARGVILLTCSQAGIPIAEYKPVEVKMAVSGYGAAPKKQVQEMVKVLLRLKVKPRLDDAADALAVAICHAHSRLSLKRNEGVTG